ncbi:DUF4992 family lipoprotein [Xylanibacter caecicola]|uniref:DUF4992 family lipoprotein n=1 Tax=Xylanibacter caecicola TaxID=2736294 RepID=UPI00259CAC38|nr:DUF4992 family lipoprotein [Xylanibacter caecicola]
MRKKSLICKIKDVLPRGKGYSCLMVAVCALFFASCTNDPFDGEAFSSGVRNETLLSPNSEDITVTASPDGTQTKITWPVVQGASGYLCSVYDITNPEAPVVIGEMNNKLVDGCSIVVPRADDSNYMFSIKALGNTALNNKDAETATEVAFSSFVPAFAAIPSGTDLYEYFQNNPLPEGNTEELPIDLEAGGEYTVSGILDFGGNKVTLRCTNKFNKPTVVYGDAGTIRTSAPLAMKNLKVNCSASADAAIGLSKNPVEGLKGATGSGDYYNIMGTLYISNCEFDGVNAQFIYDNNIKYCVETVLIDNTVVRLTTTQESGVSGNAIIYFKNGFANTLNIKNSTFYQAGASNSKYFVQYSNSGRSTRAGYQKNYVIYSNSTFYNVAKTGQWSNYSGFSGQACSVFEMTNSIFVECAKEIARRFIGGSFSKSPTYVFANNTYLQDVATDAYDNEENYDQSATAIKSNPGFADPANGDFTVNPSSEQAAKRTGDPRWLPAVVEE